MKLKACLLGQSLICLGMIASHAEVAKAEVNEPSTATESLSQGTCCTVENPGDPELRFRTTPLLPHLSATAQAPIAPPEKSFRAIAPRMTQPNIAPSQSCPAAKAIASSIQSEGVNPVPISSTSAPRPHCDGIPPELVSLSSPEATVERSNHSRPLHQFSEVGSMPNDLLAFGGQVIAEIQPPEAFDLPSSPAMADPELGQLRLWEASSDDPELGRLRLWEQPSGDPELGRLRLQEQPILEETTEEEDTVFLLGRVSFFNSDNILLDDFDPVDDQVFQGGLGLFAAPSIGPSTYLFGSVGASLSVYNHLSELNYSDLEFQAGIRQVVFPNTYVDASWSNQQFFGLDNSGRFLNDHSLRLSLSHREPLTTRLFLDGYYQLRFSFTDPSDRSRIFNNFGLSLGYDLQPGLEAGLGYQLILSDFTQQQRHDSYHEVTAQLSYDFSENGRVTVFGGLSFGDSTESSLNFDSSLFGIIFSTNFSLF